MRNMHEIIGNAVIIGGLLSTVGGAVDLLTHAKQLEKDVLVYNAVSQKYGITQDCSTGVFSPGATFCSLDVPNATSQEQKDQIIDQFENELKASGFQDRGNTDGAISGAGLTAILVGTALKHVKDIE